MIISCFSYCWSCLQNSNALDSKVTVDFDHVKNSLKVDDEGIVFYCCFVCACW